MARQIQLRRGTTTQTNAFTGALAEVTVDTDKDTVVVHDGSTAGGHPLVKTSDLGTAATTAASDYATAAQGALADTAVQPDDSPSFGSVTVSGTVDGRDVATDGSKLDGIEAGATADQTGAQIKTAYEAEPSAFTDAQFTKLAGIEASADVTDTANVTSAGALMDSEVANLAQVKAFDSSDYATAAQGTTADAALPKAGGAMTGPITTNSTFDGRDVATDGAKLDNITVSQAVDLDQMEIDIAALANGMVYKGDWDASAGSFPGSGSAQVGWFYYVSVAGTVGGVSFSVGDNIVAIADNASTSTYASNWSKHDQTDAVTAVVGLNGSITKSGLLSALNVEDGADVTDATNVTAAGALMDSEVTNLAQVKAFDSTDYATAAQGSTADAALPKSGGAMTGAITTSSTFDGRDVATDGAKLDGIEAGATADQTKADIDALGIAASTAATLATARNIALSGDVSGSASFNGSANISITATVADDSHNHVISNVDGLQTALDGKQASGTYNTVIGTDSDINTSGSTIIDNIFVTDGVITSMGTRTLTLGDLGYTGATNANYITNNNQLTNGAGYTTNTGDITGVTAGTNLTGGGASGSVTLNVSSSPSFSGVVSAESVQEDYDALSGTSPAPDADNAGGFSLTMTGNTTFSFGGVTSGRAVGFVLQVTGNGSTLTWPSTVDWAGGTAPDAPASGASNLYVFYTRDGGSNWIGALSVAAYA